MRYLVTGTAGQDGILMSRLLLREGAEVIGLCKKEQVERLSKLLPGITLCNLEGANANFITPLLQKYRPTHIFNLAGFSSVKNSWSSPVECMETNSGLVVQIVDWIMKYDPSCKLVQASSSEIFGGSFNSPQTEDFAHCPSSPYGLSKSYSHNLIKYYRERFSLNISSAILYNHESPLRKKEFVSKHVVRNVARIGLGMQDSITIGNLNSRRDWGWAPDYVLGMKKMTQLSYADDFIFATGIQHSVNDFLTETFSLIGIKDFSKYLIQDGNEFRRVDPSNLCGDSTKAKLQLNWKQSKNFQEIVKAMFEWEIQVLNGEDSDNWIYL